MPNLLAGVAKWLSRWNAASRVSRDAAPRDVVAVRSWVAIGVSGPVPMLDMYRDILRQHGIQAVIADAGVGPGALGGVPGFGALRVAASDAAAARALLHADADQDDMMSASQTSGGDERIVNLGE